MEFDGKVALITGAASGIGAGVARALAGLGAQVVVADVDDTAGQAVADEIGGHYTRCDVRDPDALTAAVALTTDRFGGLDLAILNAGISTGMGLGEDFDVERYRAVMGVNLDGVVFGVRAALPALRARGGGRIVVTASMAGLMPVPIDPLYGANKAAVVGLVRSLGPQLAASDVIVNAVCPSFADTAIITTIRDGLTAAGMPIMPVSAVVDAYLAVLRGGQPGECWFVQANRAPEPFAFRTPPGPRTEDGARVELTRSGLTTGENRSSRTPSRENT
ncbi:MULTISPECIES: SDR family oxidoreductase [Actinosynnema]|uniref:SDR family oxidoreductase n=1 Tax=Actinosynnema TaxID=40566 RepID=UPI0020A4A874|nr:SDR family NAD(P)-dependent oxidoreductase [Actinosynnema pretiosum]MCP2095548.1 NADP-dependent 3-hydroxy acid dehydrogenase YdfG [Actinosynnema pretiosum]